MVQLGRALRYTAPYEDEVTLAREEGFSFFQLWYYQGALSIATMEEPRAEKVREAGFPVILHAVFDMHEYRLRGEALMELVDFFGHREVIVHPVCKRQPITPETVHQLAEELQPLRRMCQRRGVRLHLENNSVIDGFFNTVEELRVVFDTNPDIGLLLDLAHVNDMRHLREILSMRPPSCIHIADQHFSVPHEHLTLGEGELDFELIFSELIPGYVGRVIMEAVDNPAAIRRSKRVLDRLFAPGSR